jgi:hypothetical protein
LRRLRNVPFKRNNGHNISSYARHRRGGM